MKKNAQTWTVLMSAELREAGMKVLRDRTDVEIRILPEPTDDQLRSNIAEADAVVLVSERPRLSAEIVAGAHRLRVAARNGAGYDNFDVSALSARQIPLATTGDANSVAVAEHNFYLMMALAKRGIVYDRAARTGDWQIRRSGASMELAGKAVLVVGYGRVGRLVAVRCRAFGMNVVAADPYVADADAAADCVQVIRDFRDGLPAADFVSLCLAMTEDSRGMVSDEVFARMKPTAYLVNTSRGGLVDEGALLRALQASKIAGAGLDVLETEPPSPDNPLLKLDRVILTPHTAALNSETLDRMAARCAQNVLDGLDRRLDPRMVVNAKAIGLV